MKMPSSAYTKGVTNTSRSRRLAVIVRRWARRHMEKHPEPDIWIGGRDNPYLKRWYVIPRNVLFNVYLHEMLRDDDDRALHDHPWWSISLNLGGTLGEIYKAGDFEIHRWFCFGDVVRRPAKFAHRLLVPRHAMTLFVTGPKIRPWGFHCDPPVGWRHWRIFTGGKKGELVGKGCQP